MSTAAEIARDEAIRHVAKGNAAWIETAIAAVRLLAVTNHEFTTDEVWAALDERNVEPPSEGRAMGAAMHRAALLGIIKATDRTRKSSRVACHARPVRVWQSLKPAIPPVEYRHVGFGG